MQKPELSSSRASGTDPGTASAAGQQLRTPPGRRSGLLQELQSRSGAGCHFMYSFLRTWDSESAEFYIRFKYFYSSNTCACRSIKLIQRNEAVSAFFSRSTRPVPSARTHPLRTRLCQVQSRLAEHSPAGIGGSNRCIWDLWLD